GGRGGRAGGGNERTGGSAGGWGGGGGRGGRPPGGAEGGGPAGAGGGRGRGPCHASPAAPGCSACIGEPCERKTLGKALMRPSSPGLPPASLPAPSAARRRAYGTRRGSATGRGRCRSAWSS